MCLYTFGYNFCNGDMMLKKLFSVIILVTLVVLTSTTFAFAQTEWGQKQLNYAKERIKSEQFVKYSVNDYGTLKVQLDNRDGYFSAISIRVVPTLKEGRYIKNTGRWSSNNYKSVDTKKAKNYTFFVYNLPNNSENKLEIGLFYSKKGMEKYDSWSYRYKTDSFKVTNKEKYKVFTSNNGARRFIRENLEKGKKPSKFLLKTKEKKYSPYYVCDLEFRLHCITEKYKSSVVELMDFNIIHVMPLTDGRYDYYVFTTIFNPNKKINKRALKVNKWINKAVRYAKKSKTTLGRIKKVNKFLMDSGSYDWKAYKKGKYHRWDFTAEGLALHKKAVCSGYVSAATLILNRLGVETILVESKTHAWNLVKYGRRWYHLDVTWNDCVHSKTKYTMLGKNLERNRDHKLLRRYKTKFFKKNHPISSKNLRL